MEPSNQPATAGSEPRCQYCGMPILARRVRCRACDTPHHQECFEENGQCTVYGCASRTYMAQARTGSPAAAAVREVAPRAERFPFLIQCEHWVDELGVPILLLDLLFVALLFGAAFIVPPSAPPWLRETVSLFWGLGLGSCLVMPVFASLCQIPVKKYLRYSERRARLELCWRFWPGFTLAIGILPGKHVTAVSVQDFGLRSVTCGRAAGVPCRRYLFDHKGAARVSVDLFTTLPADVQEKLTEDLRKAVSAPDVAAPPPGWLDHLSPSSLLLLSSAVEIGIALGLQILTVVALAILLR